MVTMNREDRLELLEARMRDVLHSFETLKTTLNIQQSEVRELRAEIRALKQRFDWHEEGG